MRQTLFYLPTQIAGYPLFGTGILFWIILLVGIFTVARNLIFRKSPGDAIFYASLTALGLLLVRFVGPSIAEVNGFPIRGYGVFLTVALAVAGGLSLWRGKKLWNFPPDRLFTVLFVAAVFGIIGARCFYVVQYWHEYASDNLRDTILAVVNLTNGGLVVYGSIIGGAVATIVYLLVKRIPVLPTLDLLIPAVMLGVAIGRLGCLMNGCCFGGPCDLPWAISFPPGSPAYMQQLDEGVISLYGVTLAPPNVSDDEKTLFSLKTKHVNLASEIPSQVVVASVDPGSEAEEAGIKPGDRIIEMGIVPKGFLKSEDATRAAFDQRTISRFRAANNAQVFYFFLNIWNENAENDVWLVLQEQTGVAGSEPGKTRNIVFHPTHAKARPVHPTQIYSSVNAFIIFCILIIVARFAKRDGLVLGVALVLYPLNRFCLELLRTDEESFCGTGLTVSQCVSVCVLFLGIALLTWTFTHKPKQALAGFFTEESETVQAKRS